MPDINDTAKRFDTTLESKGEERHAHDLRPFMETADALRRDAGQPSEHLDPIAAKNQRIVLMNMAENQAAGSKQKEARVESRRWYWFGGAIATVVAVFVVAVVVQKQMVSLPSASDMVRGGVARVLIPEAHAGDAFSMLVESTDAAGADAGTSFKVTTKVKVTPEQLQQVLRVVPALAVAGEPPSPVEIKIEKIGGNEFRVQPAKTLEAGRVYRLSLAAAVQKEDGSSVERDFSWAVQTKDVFRVTSSVPANGANGVPVNIGIEFNLSQENWEEPAAFFSMEPKVEGRFERHGRSLTFVPAKPLAYGRLYTVTLKKGLKVQNSSLGLASDAVLKFETQTPPALAIQPVRVTPTRGRIESYPDKEAIVYVWAENAKDKDVAITGYALGDKDVDFLRELLTLPNFAEATRQETHEKYAKNKSFELTAKLEEVKSYGRNFLRLPKIAAGRYIVKLQPKDGLAAWMYLESTYLATYATADEKTLVVWAMNGETQRPLTDLPVRYGTVDMKTDAQGLARLPTPPALNSTSTPWEIIQMGAGNLSALVVMSKNGASWDWYGFISNNENTVSYLYMDRPIYKTTDKLEAYGLAQDRKTKRAAGKMVLELTQSSYYAWDYPASSEEKVFRRAEIAPDEFGFYRASLDWSTLAPGYYSVQLRRDGQVVSTRNFEIRDFIKPAYTLEVITRESAVFRGEAIQGEVRATFFDGTPVAKLGLDLKAGVGGADFATNTQALVTDSDGRATFSLLTNPPAPCPSPGNYDCDQYASARLSVTPAEAEEAEIDGEAYVPVYRARARLEVEAPATGNQAQITVKMNAVDLASAENYYMTGDLGAPLAGRKVKVKVIERWYETVSSGTGYDYIEKKTYPQYSYVSREKEVMATEVTTDTSGNATLPFTLPNDHFYEVIASAADDRGVDVYGSTGIYKSWVTAWKGTAGYSSDPDEYLSLEQVDLPPGEYRNRRLGEKVALHFTRDGKMLQDSSTPTFLYMQAQLGLGEASVSSKAGYEFTFNEASVPNMYVFGVAFVDRKFVERSVSLSLDTEARALDIALEMDKPSYAPGAQARVHVKAKDKAGQPAKQARLALSLVDEAVFAVAGVWGEGEDPLSTLYSWVESGIIARDLSHDTSPYGDETGFGGAEKGGGGASGIRRNFKDTAAFEVVTLDQNGESDVTLALPDNITSWRMTAVAITPDLYAGSARSKMAVTKPVFVDVVAPATQLSSDKPIWKLRAYGTGLASSEPVTFKLEAPTLGLKSDELKGTVNAPTYFSLDQWPEGEHAVVVRVTSSRGTDAIEKKIRVVSSRFQRLEMVRAELAPGVALADTGASRLVEVSFIPTTRAQYLDRLRSLAASWSGRVDAQYAKVLAERLLKDYLNEKVEIDESGLLRYQKQTGGISLLSYSTEDVEVSAKIAALETRRIFDADGLNNYLWQVAQNKDVSREEAARALSGAAAYGAPVLNRLHEFAAAKDLSWREQLAVIRGLEAAGDREAAAVMFETLLSKGVEQGDAMFIRVSGDRREITEATAEVAAFASIVVHPQAGKLDAWMEKNWAEDAFTPLDRITYLARVVPRAVGRDVVLKYAVDGKEETLELHDGNSAARQFTPAEARSLRITSVDAPAVMVFLREVSDLPAVSPDITLTRTYSKAGSATLGELVEGDTVIVSFQADFGTASPDGCYTLRDHVPAGLAPILNYSTYASNEGRPFDWRDGAAFFTVCRLSQNQQKQGLLQYRARVVGRGTYLAEPAVIQSMTTPSVTALSKTETVTIK